jgi:hypothetical protein
MPAAWGLGDADDVRRALQPGPRRADHIAGEEPEAGRHLDPPGVLGRAGSRRSRDMRIDEPMVSVSR